jgi:hypothetical protein
MCRTGSISLLIFAMLMSASAAADEAAQPTLTPAAEAFLADLARASWMQSPDYSWPMSYTDNYLRPLPDVDFEDGSLLGRFSHLRRISFLTFAEIGEAQFFFGLNKEGLLGLHFNIDRKKRRERLELLRMPYLLADKEESTK